MESVTAPAEGADAADEAKPAKRSRKKLLLLALPVLLVGLLAGLWFGGILPRLLGVGHGAAAPAAASHALVFVELPELVANLNAPGRTPHFVKLGVKLEVARPEDAALVQAAMPRVVDLFETYLREMRPEELRGAAGTYRLREELLGRVLSATAPARVNDVLFTEMLVQ